MTATTQTILRRIYWLGFALAIGVPGLYMRAAENAASTGASPVTDEIERGRYLVTVAGCKDCHTALTVGPNGPEPDMSRMLAGRPASLEMPPAPELPDGPWIVTVSATNTAWPGPWGVSHTANLTPDRVTGLGKWTTRTFTDTIQTGRHLGRGRPILPPMPIPMYKNFTDADLDAIFSYLQSVPPISNRVPEPLAPKAAPGQ